MKIAGQIVDVLNERIFPGEVKVENGKIQSIVELQDAPCQYILPGFVDSHIHIESTLLLPENYAPLALAQGTVGVVTDPHEIANVLGELGIDFMIKSGQKVPFHFYFCAPSCVPCSPFETAGAVLDSKTIERLMARKDIFALAELMNAFGTINGDAEILAKIEAAQKFGKPVDGHAPGFRGTAAKRYVEAGVSTDHECTTLEEAEERLSMGMKILIREGSAACDFESLSPLLRSHKDNIMLCTDDKYADELLEGNINQIVSRAVKKGLPLWNVLRAACITPVEHYHLTHGILRVDDPADFIVVDSLEDFGILQTWIDGSKVYDKNQPVNTVELPKYQSFPNKFLARQISPDSLKVNATFAEPMMHVIGVTEGSLLTQKLLVAPSVENGTVVPQPELDILKIVVLNRYEESAQPSVAFAKGFGLKKGAIASTIAHDSHNIIAVGCDDNSIAQAVNQLIMHKGGISVCDGVLTDVLSLPIAGLMSPEKGEVVGRQHRILKEKAHSLGCQFAAPFMTLAFMALPVIPELKLTDIGLFDSSDFKFTSLLVEQNS